jgi:glutamate racemase
MGPGVTLTDSAVETAAAVSRVLAHSTLQAPPDVEGRVHFVVSDAPEQFEKVGGAFLGDRVRDVETVPLGERH